MLHSLSSTFMSNTRKISKSGKKRGSRVVEMEDVQKVDRRGKTHFLSRKVKQHKSILKKTPPLNPKQPRWRSPSPVPVASGSDHLFPKPKASKVC